MIYDNMKTVISVNSGVKSMDRARLAIERVSRELREVKAVNSVYSFTSSLGPNSSSVSFLRTISGSDVTVTIARSGSNVNLQYSSPAVTSTLADGVSSFTMDFYDADGSATNSTTDVRFVQITMVVTDSASGQSASQRMRIALRNG
jgi:hypothetical protein